MADNFVESTTRRAARIAGKSKTASMKGRRKHAKGTIDAARMRLLGIAKRLEQRAKLAEGKGYKDHAKKVKEIAKLARAEYDRLTKAGKLSGADEFAEVADLLAGEAADLGESVDLGWGVPAGGFWRGAALIGLGVLLGRLSR